MKRKDVYSVKNGLIEKSGDEWITSVADYASYAYHHMKRTSTVANKDSAQIVFADMTPEQISSSFIKSFGPGDTYRKHFEEEMQLSVLLETAGWLSDNLKYGCVMCAPFL